MLGIGDRHARRGRIRAPLWLAVLALACGEAEAPPSQAPPAETPAVPVRTALAGRGEITLRITAPGTLAALRESRIGAEVSGRLQHVFVDEGDRVAEGDPLFQIDPEPYELGLRQARAGLDLARAERRQTESDLKRLRDLRGKDVVAQQQVDRMETNLAVARAREAQAAEAVRMAELELSRTRVHAPYAGAVVHRLADEGTTALTQPQTIVLVLQEIHELEGRATIPEAHLDAVHPGDRAVVTVEGHAEPIETVVSSVGEAVDPATRTYEVKMRVPNPNHRLKSGVFAEMEIFPAPREGVLLVPREAIRTEEGRTRVMAVRDGTAVALPVTLGVVSREAAEVLAGLEPGERVIVGEAAQTIAPGMRVEVDGEAGGAS